MKRHLAITAACLLALACGSKEETKADAKPSVPDCTFPDDGKTVAPQWVCTESVEGFTVGAQGSAQATGAGADFQKTMAETAARTRLATQFQTQVQAMTKQYTSTTGGGDAETVDKVLTAVSKQITNETLAGTKAVRTQLNPNTKVLYVFVAMDKATAKQAAATAVKTSIGNDQALWQRFLEKKSQDELAEEISKLVGDHGAAPAPAPAAK